MPLKHEKWNGRAAKTPLLSETYRLGCEKKKKKKKQAQHDDALEVNSSVFETKKRSKISGENGRLEGTEEGNLNNGVKPQNTGPVMDAVA